MPSLRATLRARALRRRAPYAGRLHVHRVGDLGVAVTPFPLARRPGDVTQQERHCSSSRQCGFDGAAKRRPDQQPGTNLAGVAGETDARPALGRRDRVVQRRVVSSADQVAIHGALPSSGDLASPPDAVRCVGAWCAHTCPFLERAAAGEATEIGAMLVVLEEEPSPAARAASDNAAGTGRCGGHDHRLCSGATCWIPAMALRRSWGGEAVRLHRPLPHHQED